MTQISTWLTSKPRVETTVDGTRWVLIRLQPEWPIECYRVNDDGLEIFQGYLHQAQAHDLVVALVNAWRAAEKAA